MRHRSSLSLQSDEADAPARRGSTGALLLAVILGLLLLAAGFLGYEVLRRMERVEGQVAALSASADRSATVAQEAMQRASAAEAGAREAAQGRQVAEAETAGARQEAATAREEATSARETAARAEAEAARIRKQADAEMKRLQEALGQIAETRRTALGLVMNLGGEHLKFDFDKAELKPPDRELLSRIAGILLTSQDYTISVNGHTDDVGSAAYNQELSKRRAQAVRDYLVKVGLPPEILSVEGHGKALPLVRGTSDAARAKNRRVELGIAQTRILYGRSATQEGSTPDEP